MKYISTRNNSKEFNFSEVFIKGLADDGGLFIPKTIPAISEQDLLRLSKLNYKELAKEIGNNPKYSKDINLLLSQTKRCSDILKNFSQDQLKMMAF